MLATLYSIWSNIVEFEVFDKTLGHLLKFGFFSGAFGAIVFVIDWSAFQMNPSKRKLSLLGIRYGGAGRKNAFLLLCLWSLGGGLVGALGLLANLISNSAIGAIGVGVSWPFIFTKLVKQSKSIDDDGDDDETNDEEESDS